MITPLKSSLASHTNCTELADFKLLLKLSYTGFYLKEVLRKAGDALARVLGPVHELFEEGVLFTVLEAFSDFYTPLSLDHPPLRLKKKALVKQRDFVMDVNQFCSLMEIPHANMS